MKEPLLHYRVDGEGPHVVLLHPVGLDLTFFDPVAAELSRHCRVLRVDLRGHGDSPPAKMPQELAGHAADIHEVLAHLHYAPAVVIGFSLGGMLAQTLAINYPADVQALVIGTCPSTFSDDVRGALLERGALAEREGMGAALDATMARWFTASFRERGLDEPARQRLLADDVGSWAQAWRAIAKLHTTPALASIGVPTLCLAAELDVSSPPSVVGAIAQSIPGARFVTIPGAPHMVFIEQPAAVVASIRAFLAEVL